MLTNAFGNITNKTENADNPYTYCGEYTDKETGNIYLRARYYDPGVGRFLSQDPYWTPRNRIYGSQEDVQNPNINAIRQSVNLYAYCANNPVIFTDPSGLDAQLDEYINANYSGTKNVTLVIQRPVANSRNAASIENGKLNNGHSFIRLDDGNGNVQYIGFGPKSNSITNMILGCDVDGHFINDSKTDWNVAKVYTLTDEQYADISNYIAKVQEQNPDYNIENYNCTTFAVNTVKVSGAAVGNFMTVKKHNWTLPSDMERQLANYQALPNWLSPVVAAWVINNTMGNFYGYTPADAAQDLKTAEGIVLLKYDGTVKPINNTFYFK